MRIVLASGSATRRALLAAAGLAFEVDPADVDEGAIRDALLARSDAPPPGAVAEALAEAKALAVSPRHPGALVIGADQVLACEGRLFEKARSMDEARTVLDALRGKTHALHSAVVLCRDGEILWRHTESAQLTMRPFSEAAREAYLARVGDLALASVGAYQIEGPALQLFESVDGAYTTILGLPLLPLLGALRREGALTA